MSEDIFYYDDYFFSDEDTMPIEIEVRGIKIPFQIKKGISTADTHAAKKNAVKTRIKPDGNIELLGFDEAIFEIELVARCVKSWPFKNHDRTMVPITRENIALLDGAVTAQLSASLKTLIQKGKEALLAPLGSPSGDPS